MAGEHWRACGAPPGDLNVLPPREHRQHCLLLALVVRPGYSGYLGPSRVSDHARHVCQKCMLIVKLPRTRSSLQRFSVKQQVGTRLARVSV